MGRGILHILSKGFIGLSIVYSDVTKRYVLLFQELMKCHLIWILLLPIKMWGLPVSYLWRKVERQGSQATEEGRSGFL
jgi:hypothetical protein